MLFFVFNWDLSVKAKISNTVLNFFPLVLVLYEISNYLANDAYLPAMPSIARELQTTHHWVQLTLTAFFLGNASMQLILGPISERYGRRFLLLSGGLVFIIATIICASSHNINLFLIARFFQGAAVTSMVVAGYATVHALYDQIRAIKTLAWMGSITVLAPALGPLFGALILMFSSWRWIFIVLAIWASLALLILFRLMPETCEERTAIDFKKILPQYGRVLMNTGFLKPMLALSILFSAMIAWISAGPFLVMDYFRHSALSFGILQGLVFGSFILGSQLLRRLLDTLSFEKITQLSLALALCAGVLGFILNLAFAPQLFTLIFPMMLFALAAGIGFSLLSRLGIEASHESMGIKMALFSSFIGVSGLLGSIISSIYAETSFGFSTMILIFSLALLPFLKREFKT